MAEQSLNRPAEIPPELDRWNWGAFFLNWIWGIGNSTFIALLCLVPLFGFVMMFVLGARGSRWAWRNRVWRDAEHFRKTQRYWAIAGLTIWLGVIGLFTAAVVSIPMVLKGSEAYRMTMEAVQADERVKSAIGDTLSTSFWIGGRVNVALGGTGEAAFSIPIHGENGSGTAISHAVRNDGKWSMRVLLVRVDGSDQPIVLVNADNIRIPEADLGI